MTTKFAAIAAIAIAASGIAATASASDQLARSLGVAPGAYSTAQLIQLRNALEDGDSQRAAFIIDGSSAAGATAGSQLAASLGVAPGSYSTADLAALKAAVEKGDASRAAFIADSHEVTARNAAAVSANRQLPLSLGVAPGQADSATLAALYLDATGRADD